MTDLQTLQKYDNWKKAKKQRKTYINLIATLLGLLLSFLLTWGILKVSAGDSWTLTKTLFASDEKIIEYIPKIEEVDNKLKNSIVAKPMKWLSKKHEEEIKSKTQVVGPIIISPSLTSSVKSYAGMLLFVWFAVLCIIAGILGFIIYWIISSFVWKEPVLTEQGI